MDSLAGKQESEERPPDFSPAMWKESLPSISFFFFSQLSQSVKLQTDKSTSALTSCGMAS